MMHSSQFPTAGTVNSGTMLPELFRAGPKRGLARRLSRPAALLAALLLAGCGGGGSGSGGGNDTDTGGSTSRQLLADTPLEVGGTVGQAVATPPGVRLIDGNGAPVSGVTVSFRVQAGSGTVLPASVTTDGQGRARAQSWTLGTTAGANVLFASVEGPAAELRFVGVGEPAAPSVLVAASALQQTGEVDTVVADPPAVRVRDAFGNAVPGVLVNFSVVAGSGAIAGSPAVTSADGLAALSSWTLGAAEGPNEVNANLAGAAAVTFSANGLPPLGLSIDAVRLNQASQSAAGDIDAVAGRPALLRVVVSAGRTNSLVPRVRLRLTRNGTLVREAIIDGPPGGVPTSPDLSVEGQTWNLLLSGADVAPGLAVEAFLDPDGLISAANRDAFRFPRGAGQAPLAVRALPPLNLQFIPIHASRNDMTGNITTANLAEFLVGTRQWLPAGALTPQLRSTPFTTDLDLSNQDEIAQLLGDIQALRTMEGATDAYYHGIIPRVPNLPIAGIAYRPTSPTSRSRTALSYDRLPQASATVAHELGHNMGRRHSPCGDPDNVDTSYPYPNGGIGVTGFDILGNRLRGPQGFSDYMGYCGTNWTSDYTYRAILDWRTGDPLAAATGGPGVMTMAAPEHGVLLWGGVNSSRVMLNPALSMVAPPVLPESGGSQLLRGTTADGRVLFELAFEGAAVPHAADPGERHFAFFVPLSIQDAAALERVELAGPQGYTMRAARRVSARPLAGAEQIVSTEMARHEIHAAMLPGGEAELSWNPERHPVAVVRDRVSGRILAIARGGELRLPPGVANEVTPELLLSDGVRSETSILLEFR
jgi:hypothetical protein